MKAKSENLACPRCNSTNTKFCYFNNFSLSQPRYFCKTCRRYWTHSSTLRNVPVGGTSRVNSNRSRSSISDATPSLPPPLTTSTASFVQPGNGVTQADGITWVGLGLGPSFGFQDLSVASALFAMVAEGQNGGENTSELDNGGEGMGGGDCME